MADLPEHPPADGSINRESEPIKSDKEAFVSLAKLSKFDRTTLDKLVWDNILWKWQSEYPSDRHVAPLFFRSDMVLHHLAQLITEQIAEARVATIIAQRYNPDQQAKLDAWVAEQQHATLERQRAAGSKRDHAYHGAIGGSLTLVSTPTTLGTVTQVWYAKGTRYEAMIDLTDYKDW